MECTDYRLCASEGIELPQINNVKCKIYCVTSEQLGKAHVELINIIYTLTANNNTCTKVVFKIRSNLN